MAGEPRLAQDADVARAEILANDFEKFGKAAFHARHLARKEPSDKRLSLHWASSLAMTDFDARQSISAGTRENAEIPVIQGRGKLIVGGRG